jgi:hypothetical protein
VKGSGRTDVCDIAPFETTIVQNSAGTDESYYPVFDVPIITDFLVKNLRPGDINLYYPSDSTVKKQEITITPPDSFNETSAYITVTNNSKTGGIYFSQNGSQNRMTFNSSLFPGESKSTINTGETAVFCMTNPADLHNFTLRPNDIAGGSLNYRSGFVYSFVFDGKEIILTDARPLHRIGEPVCASVKFAGMEISQTGQKAIFQAIRDTLAEQSSPVLLADTADQRLDEQIISYVFLVTVIAEKKRSQYADLVEGSVRIELLRDGKKLAEYTGQSIIEFSADLFCKLAAKKIREDPGFYDTIGGKL